MEVSKLKELDYAVEQVLQELLKARQGFSGFNSAHEGFSILNEEVDELWDEVKVNQKKRNVLKLRGEAIQVAAMALRFILDCTNPDGSGYGK